MPKRSNYNKPNRVEHDPSKYANTGKGHTGTTVVNSKTDEYDVYIGRPSKWGNPFKIGKDGTREQVVDKYEEWFRSQPALVGALVRELAGKRLGCHCAPELCHGDVLVRYIERFIAPPPTTK